MTASSTLYLDRRCNVHRYLLECLETKLNIIYFNQTTLAHPLIVNYIEEQKNLQKLSHLIFYAPCSLLRCRNERCCCCKTLTTVHFVTRIAQLFFVKSIHEQLSALPDQHRPVAHYQIPSYQSEARLFIADKNQYQGPENALVL